MRSFKIFRPSSPRASIGTTAHASGLAEAERDRVEREHSHHYPPFEELLRPKG